MRIGAFPYDGDLRSSENASVSPLKRDVLPSETTRFSARVAPRAH